MSEASDYVSREILRAQLDGASMEGVTRFRAGDGPRVNVTGLEPPPPADNLPAAALIASDSDEEINAPVKRRPVYAGADRKASLAAALEEARVTAARTEDEDALYQAFRSAARELKATETAFRAAQKAYGEAVNRLSEQVSK